MTLIAIVLGTLFILFVAASRSRKRKQRIAEAAWRERFAARLQLRMNALGLPLTIAQANEEQKRFFADLYRCFRVNGFSTLMRRVTTADRADSEYCVASVCEKSAARLGTPANVSPDLVPAMIRLALEEAGGEAQEAADRSGEV